MVKFKCPHRPMPVTTTDERELKRAMRAFTYTTPATTVWIVEENGWSADVECPACHDVIRVETDQDPGGTSA